MHEHTHGPINPPSTHHTKHTEEVASRLEVGALHGPGLVLRLGAPRRLVPPVEQARELQQVFLLGRVDRWGGRSAHDTDNVVPPLILNPNPPIPSPYQQQTTDHNRPLIPSSLSTATNNAAYLDLQRLAGLAEAEGVQLLEERVLTRHFLQRCL